MPKKMKTEFTPRQEAFVREYPKCLNATQAAIRAGYNKKCAGTIAAELLQKPAIKNLIQRALAKRAERTGIDADWVLRRLAEETEADALDIFTDDGNLKPMREWPLIWRQGLVAGMDVEVLFEGRGADRERVGTVTKVRLSDRVKRLELIGRHVNVQAFRERIEHSGPDGGPIQTQAVDVSRLSDEDLARLEAILLKAAPEVDG